MTLTIDEGKILRKVVADTGRIVQVGTQQRADGRFQTAVELVRNGRIGKLRHVEVTLPLWTTKGGPFPAQPVPENLDWDMYQGQAPEHDYCSNRTHFNFRWWFEYAGGIITDWGQHFMDIAHWGMDLEGSGPLSVECRSANFPNEGKPDCYNNPDSFVIEMTFPGGIELLYNVAINKETKRNGIKFTGDAGRIHVNRGGLYGKAFEELKENPFPDDAWRAYPNRDHMGNFFECVKSRKAPAAPVDIGHRVITSCHLGNIAIRLKRKINWDPKTEQVVGDDEANGWQRREQRAPYLVTR